MGRRYATVRAALTVGRLRSTVNCPLEIYLSTFPVKHRGYVLRQLAGNGLDLEMRCLPRGQHSEQIVGQLVGQVDLTEWRVSRATHPPSRVRLRITAEGAISDRPLENHLLKLDPHVRAARVRELGRIGALLEIIAGFRGISSTSLLDELVGQFTEGAPPRGSMPVAPMQAAIPDSAPQSVPALVSLSTAKVELVASPARPAESASIEDQAAQLSGLVDFLKAG